MNKRGAQAVKMGYNLLGRQSRGVGYFREGDEGEMGEAFLRFK